MEETERQSLIEINEEIGRKYWTSSSYYASQSTRWFPNVNGFLISVVLDLEARHDFSAIRVLILCKQSEDPGTITIARFKDPNQCGIFASDGSRRRYRSRLTTEFQGSREIQLPLARVCTVAFDLERHENNNLEIVEFPIHKLQNEPLRRIAFDYVHHIDPTDPGLLVFLSINQVLQPFSLPQPRADALHIPTHGVRVVPVPSNRRSVPIILPPSIVRRIMEHFVCNKYYGWRPDLLNYSLVCKGWEDVLELFFVNLGVDGRNPAVDARHVLRTLRWRPHYGALIHRHRYNDYLRNGDAFYGGTSGWEAFCEILKLATRAHHVCLPTTPLELVDGLMSILRGFRSVGDLVVRQNYDDEEERPLMNMADIQMAIREWPPLSKLALRGLGEARERDSEYKLPDHLQCGPQAMTLRGAPLTPGQLLRLVSPINCQLTNVILDHVSGPTNAEFRAFLSIAAPTLRTLDMHVCRFSRPHDEELALDAVMPEMKSLIFLVTSSSFASISSVTRKTVPTSATARIWIYFAGSDTPIQDVEKAMHVTKWNAVTISWKDVPLWDPSLVAQAEGAARDRGIQLNLRQNWAT